MPWHGWTGTLMATPASLSPQQAALPQMITLYHTLAAAQTSFISNIKTPLQADTTGFSEASPCDCMLSGRRKVPSLSICVGFYLLLKTQTTKTMLAAGKGHGVVCGSEVCPFVCAAIVHIVLLNSCFSRCSLPWPGEIFVCTQSVMSPLM